MARDESNRRSPLVRDLLGLDADLSEAERDPDYEFDADGLARQNRLAPRWLKEEWKQRSRREQQLARGTPRPMLAPPGRGPADPEDAWHIAWRTIRQWTTRGGPRGGWLRQQRKAFEELEFCYWQDLRELARQASRLDDGEAEQRFKALRAQYAGWARAIRRAPVKGEARRGRPRRLPNVVVLEEVEALSGALDAARHLLRRFRGRGGVTEETSARIVHLATEEMHRCYDRLDHALGEEWSAFESIGAQSQLSSDGAAPRDQRAPPEPDSSALVCRPTRPGPGLVLDEDLRWRQVDRYKQAVWHLGLTGSTGAKLRYLFRRLVLPLVFPAVCMTRWSIDPDSPGNLGPLLTSQPGFRRRLVSEKAPSAEATAVALVATMHDMMFDEVARIVALTRKTLRTEDPVQRPQQKATARAAVARAPAQAKTRAAKPLRPHARAAAKRKAKGHRKRPKIASLKRSPVGP